MKKGFTLVELLASIVLLGLLMMVSYPKIIEMVENKNEEIDESKQTLIYSAVDTYINNNLNDYPKDIGAKYCFSIDFLDKENLIPVDVDDYLTKSVRIIIGKTNSYKVVESTTCD